MARSELVFTGTGSVSFENDCATHDDCAYYVGGLAAGETLAVQHYTNAWVQAGHYQGSTNEPAIFTGSGGSPPDVNCIVLRGNLYRFVGTVVGAITISRVLGRVVNER